MKKIISEKKYVFDEAIDNKINALAVSMTFILIGILLYFNILKIGNDRISIIIQWIFIIFGILIVFTSLGNKGESDNKIKGFDSLGIGIFFLICWYLINKFTFILIIIINIIILILGCYGTIRGILEILYSLKIKLNNLRRCGIFNIISEIFILLTKFSAFILTLLNILQALKII